MPFCDLILPCRNEAAALVGLLPKVSDDFAVIVIDNGSTDNTAQVAQRLGARVIYEPVPGYGSAIHAGLEAASHDYVAFMDGDGSFDPSALIPMLAQVRDGADMAIGRRRPSRAGVWPWHARCGNALIVAWLRRRIDMSAHDIAPIRVCRRRALVDLNVHDRRFGYPVELLQKATAARWRLVESDVAYGPRAAGTKSKVSGSVVGTLRTARDFWKVLS